MTTPRPIDVRSIRSCASKVVFTVDIDGKPVACEVNRAALLGTTPTRADFLTKTDGLLLKELARIQRMVDATFADGRCSGTVTTIC